MVKKVKTNPIHLIIGVTLLTLGVFLVSHDHYFVWPPVAAGAANNNFVGCLFVFTGLGMTYWVFSKSRSVKLDHFLLTVAAMLMMLLAAYQFLHWFIAGIDMPWISNLALTGIIINLAYRSDVK